MQKKTTIKTYLLITVAVVFLFVAIIVKLCYVVLSDEVDGVNLHDKAASVTTTKELLYASRGVIYDADGEVLAQTVNSYTLIAYLDASRTDDEENPQHVIDKETTAEALSEVLGASYEYILERLNKDAYQVQFGSKGMNLTEVDKTKIEALDLPGLDFIESTQRYYNKKEFASYIVGYAKKNEDDQIVGALGIEGYYNDKLSGTNGYREYQSYTANDYQIPNTPENIEEAKNGSDIYLTLDSNIQLILEKAISELNRNFINEWAIFSVIDANTGAIVGSATNPNFNPNDTNTISDYRNPLVSNEYEPGSVMKIFSFATAIEEDKYDGEETYKSGSIQVADRVIRDAERDGWGTITFDQGFAYSSNVASTTLALRLGIPTLRGYYEDLGFGSLTGIELYDEYDGRVNMTHETTLATASFGQGISITPIQMLQALTAITNKGVVLKPYIVSKIVDASGNVTYEGSRTEVKKVYSEETVLKMQELMYDVVYNGLVKFWQPENVTIIGKTGTAQIPSPQGGYLTGEFDYITSFAGIFPADNPKYIMYVATRGFQGTKTDLANLVTTSIEEIASYAKITESTSDVDYSKIITLDNYISKKTTEMTEDLEKQNLVPVVIGDGKYIINQYPLKNTEMLIGNKLFLVTNSTNYLLPDMTGWSRNDVTTYCNLVDITCNISGYGYVASQTIGPNTSINNETIVDIQLNTRQIE